MPLDPNRMPDLPPLPEDAAPAERELSDPDATVCPDQADPFASDGFWDASGGGQPRNVDATPRTPPREHAADTPAPPSGPNRRPQADADADATFVPDGARQIEDVWGEDFGGLSPAHTLKEPRRVRPGPAAGAKGSDAVPADVALAGYRLEKLLGEGGAGVVYAALQESVDRQIAVKMIKSAVGRSANERQKFIAEAKLTGDLDHPNIVPIHDLGITADGQPFYTMKLVRGTPWSAVIAQQSLDENLRVLLDVCDAVAFAHAKGIIHRDLKPDNVMLGEFGEVQLMDWGLGASVREGGKATPITQTRPAGGTPAYMAPEMVTGEDAPVGVHSDVYLLGAILYEIVTGKPPHAGKRVLECLQNAMLNVIRPTEQRGPLVDIARQAMATAPADRFASVKDFKQALLDYQTHAQSIHQAEQAAVDLERAGESRDYDTYAQALFGFREALKLWPDNADARGGLSAAQLAYARCAYEKGDLDLAASLLDPGCTAHLTLAAEIREAQQRRDAVRRRLRVLRWTAIGLTGAVITILTVAAIWISAARRRAETARNAAVAAQQAEAEQRRVAEAARVKAEAEEAKALEAKTEMEKAIEAMIVARSQEEQAQARAKASELVATRARDELARSGMLLDNSWWVFDAEAARQRQREAADALGVPVDRTIDLGHGMSLELVLIPAGEFVMGSPPSEEHRAADEYLHRVTLTRPFYLGRNELTAAQWRAIVGQPAREGADAMAAAGPDRDAAKGAGDAAAGRNGNAVAARAGEAVGGRNGDAAEALPVVSVSPQQIVDALLPALQRYAPDGFVFRLPTEAEWEYACRAGTGTAYFAGDDEAALAEAGWYLHNSDRRVHEPGKKRANAFGLFDMHGNVGEICADQFDAGFYLDCPTADPLAVNDSERFVVRGGSVLNTPENCRSAYRSYVYHKNRYDFVGVRVMLEAKSGE